jgi:hypothetical protein
MEMSIEKSIEGILHKAEADQKEQDQKAQAENEA